MSDQSRTILPTGSVVQLGDTGCYEILKPLASGGMAQVFLARRKGVAGFERTVAIKRIHAQLAGNEEFERMFIQEARLASRLHHHNIAQVYDLQRQGDAFILVMEYIQGTTIRSALETAHNKDRAFSPAFACYLAADIADALHYAHTACGEDGTPLGIVHRDVSPKNIMLGTHGEAKLLDFGIAYSRLSERDKTGAGMIKGTWNYLSPEQAVGSDALDGRSDVFALALVVAELVTGRRVFDGRDADVLLNISQADPRSIARAVAGLPPPLQPALRRALAHGRDDRYPTAAAFADDLRAFMHRACLAYGAPDAAAELAAIAGAPDADPATHVASARDAAPILISPPFAAVPAPLPAPTPPPGRDVDLGLAPDPTLHVDAPARQPRRALRWIMGSLLLAACSAGAYASLAQLLGRPAQALTRTDRPPDAPPLAPPASVPAPEPPVLTPVPPVPAPEPPVLTPVPLVPAPEPVIGQELQAPPQPPRPLKALPEGVTALLARAGKLLANGDTGAALDIYGRIASDHPENAEALVGRGYCYLDLEEYAPAEASFLAALSADPRQPDALLGLAETYRNQGKNKEAIAQYEKYVQRHPDAENAEVARSALSELRR